MKILAIRGRNLASLAGEFELCFRQEPLASTGLFAISGPTGAGKSTLLDALCLALYNNTPRLAKASARGNLPDVGDETITPRDPGNLLRRGAGEGHAEVDFLGNDGVEYRARWAVRRARGKNTGKLQNIEMSLRRLSDLQTLGGVRTEIERTIEQRLGLSFAQFTRAVLLAQNEFASFLKAEDDERAALLETLTGLDAYTDISIRAHHRAKLEQQTLNDLQRQLGDQSPLTAELRSQWEQTLNTARTQAAALAQRKAELDQYLHWHQSWEAVRQDEDQAREAVTTACATRQAAAPRQRYFTQVEIVQDARPLLAEHQRTTEAIDPHQQAVNYATEQLVEAQRAHQQADEQFSLARQAVIDAEQAHSAALPDLERARQLDTEISTLAPHHAEIAKAYDEAHQHEATTKQQLLDKQTERDQTIGVHKATQDWLTAHESLRQLAEEWPRWDTLFSQAAKIHDEFGEAAQLIASHRQAEAQQQQIRDQANATLKKADVNLQIAENTLRQTAAALAQFDADMLASRRSRLDNYRDQLDSAEKIWSALASGLTRQQESASEMRRVREKLTATESELARIATAKPPALARLAQAEQALSIAEAACAKNVESLREHLQTGIPCPVCGATEHPYARGDAPSRAILAGLKTQVDACRQATNELERQEATAQANRDTNHQRLTELLNEQPALIETLQRHTDSFNAHPLAAKLEPSPAANRPIWFAEENAKVRKHQDTLSKEEDHYRQAIKANTTAQDGRDQTYRQQLAARDALNAAQIGLDRAAQTLQTAITRQEEITLRLDALLGELGLVCTEENWREIWRNDPSAYHRHQQEQAAQWRSQQQNLEQRTTRLASLEIEISNLANSANEKATHRQRIAGDFANIDQTLTDKRQQRQNLFQGRPAVEVETELTKAITDAKIHYQQQDQARQQAATAQNSAATVLNQAQQVLADSQQTADRASTAINAWIARFNAEQHPSEALDFDRLQALLAHDRAWLMQERQELQSLLDAVRDAETTLRERQARREEHQRQRPNPEPLTTIQTQHAQISSELDSVSQQTTEAELTLRQDNQRRQHSAALQQEIIAQEAKTEIWGKLDSLIGSADGKKFRNYAQGFTLDVLLGYANRHLTDLSRRYRLERVKDTLALMVVDQDMGDEYRSVHSLSGGESFLVSLALALGLASLSSNRVRVESLFIDEGFGSLDADTLRVAMDALDKLQAQGRKVGVISHVQEMTERIGVQIQVRRQSGGRSRIEVKSV